MNIRRFIVGVTTITGTYIATTSTDGKAFRTCLKMEWAKYNVKINSDTDIGMICATQCQPSQWNDFLEQSYNKSLMILTENSSGSGKTTTIKQHLQQQPRLHVWISCRSLFSSSSSYWSHVLANMGLYNVRDEDIAFRIVKRVFELFQLKGVKPLIVFDDVELLLNDVKGQKLINSFREFYNENLVSIVFVSSEHHRKELSKHIGNFRTTKLNLPSNPQWELSYNYEKINSDYDEMSQTLEITGAHMGMLTNILKLPSWQRKHELKFLIDQANVHLEENVQGLDPNVLKQVFRILLTSQNVEMSQFNELKKKYGDCYITNLLEELQKRKVLRLYSDYCNSTMIEFETPVLFYVSKIKYL